MNALLIALALAADLNPTPFASITPPSKEPKYQGGPKYLLLAFGLKAETRIWLVLDGDGDLTQPGEVVNGTTKDDRTTFSITDLAVNNRTTASVEVALFVAPNTTAHFAVASIVGAGLADGRGA
jgi:hypothetical protein